MIPVTRSALYLDSISVTFDGFKALNDCRLSWLAVSLRAAIGPNGAGKSTMMDVITGKTRPDTGVALFLGQHDLTHSMRRDSQPRGWSKISETECY